MNFKKNLGAKCFIFEIQYYFLNDSCGVLTLSTRKAFNIDAKHKSIENIKTLFQVVGKKRVTLYAPSATDSLYPHEGMLLSNTAQVDPEAPDYKVFPAYRNTQAFLCLLSPGKLLGFKCIAIGKI